MRIHLSEEGREVTLLRLYGGDVCILTASCMLEHITFEVTIEAGEDCEALLMPTAAFQKLASQNLAVENFANVAVAATLQGAMATLQQVLFVRFDERLAAFLTEEMQHTGSHILHMTHGQIAKHTGSAPEVVPHMLEYF